MNSQDNGIKLVCFDLGGVLIRICRSWEEGCVRAGFTMRCAVKREATAERRRELGSAFQTGRIDLNAYARSLSEILESAYSPSEIVAIHREWIIGEYDGVGAVIDSIHRANLRTACLSNTDQAHWLQMADVPVLAKLHTRMPSHLLGLQKPDPAIFRDAERRLDTRGNAILFFDDLEENVQAARAAGWRAVQVNPIARTDAQIVNALRREGLMIDGDD